MNGQDITIESNEAETQTESTGNNRSGVETYTREDVDDLIQDAVKQAKDAAFAEARRVFTKKDKQEPQSKSKKTHDSAPTPTVDHFAVIDAVDDAAERFGLTSKQKRALRNRLVNTDGDLGETIEEFAAIAGWEESGAESATDDTKTEGEPMKKNARPMDPGAPTTTPVWERPSNPFTWSAEDLARIRAQKANGREYQRFLRRKAEEHMRDRHLNLKKQ